MNIIYESKTLFGETTHTAEVYPNGSADFHITVQKCGTEQAEVRIPSSVWSAEYVTKIALALTKAAEISAKWDASSETIGEEQSE